MRDHYLDSIIRGKLFGYELPLPSHAWEEMEQFLNEAFEAEIRLKLAHHSVPFVAEDWQMLGDQLEEGFDQEIQTQLTELELGGAEKDWPLLAATLEGDAFDLSISEKLSGFELEGAVEGWEAIEAELDDHPLDTQLRDALAAASLAVPPMAWEGLEAQMNEAFEETLRDKLADHRLPFEAADWTLMEASLDEHPLDTVVHQQLRSYELPKATAEWPHLEEQLNLPFYRIFRQKLAYFSVPFRSADWRVMARTLRVAEGEPAVLWYQNWRSYVTAASVGLLLLFSLQFGSGLQENSSDLLADQAVPTAPQAIENPAQPAPLVSATEEPIEEVLSSTARPTQINPISAASSPGQTGEDRERESMGIFLSYLAAPSSLQPSWGQLLNEVKAPTYTAVAQAPLKPLAQERFASKDELNRAAQSWKKFPQRIGENRRLQLSLGFRSYQLQNDLDELRQGTQIKADRLRGNKLKVRVGTYMAMSNTKLELSSRNPDWGWMAGSRVELLLNDEWSVVSGLAFENRRYNFDHFIADAASNTRIEVPLQGDLALVEIPLFFRYNMPSTSQFKVYTQLGIVALIVLDETMAVAPEATDPGPSNFRLAGAQAPHQASYDTYIGNIHLSGGIEYTISDRLALQLEPYFQFSTQRTRTISSTGHFLF
ncbi:MAG: outer membrane beta-barrel protein [Bacteroidota bacterium]